MSEPNQMIPKHQAEMNAMHQENDNRNMKRLCMFIAAVMCVAIIAVAWANVEISKNNAIMTKTFVDNYTSRTEKWLETFLRMYTSTVSGTEVLNEKVQTGNVQQLPIP